MPGAATASRPRVLLLNPPGDLKYFRDYYCTKVSKAHYYYHPVDLVYLSGTLSQAADVQLIDAIAESLTIAETTRRVVEAKPDVVLFLISSPSYQIDLAYFTELRKVLPGVRFIGTGDVYRELGDRALDEHDFLDAVVLDFSTEDVLEYLAGPEGKVIDNVIYRHDGQVIAGQEKHGNGNFRIAMPRWDLFKIDSYKFPFERKSKFASILTDFGCAFSCSFCPVSTLGFKLRPIEDVVEEIKLLKTMGVRELFFRDQTFGTSKKRTLDLCAAIAPLGMSWTCFTRVDTISEEIIGPMKAAGCHTIMFGIETADEDLLKLYDKNTNQRQVIDAINLCQSHRIGTVGTFILGLPGDTRESIMTTLNFAKSLSLDFASFNIAMPRFGTKFRQEALEAGWANETEMAFESSGTKPIWKNQTLSNDEIFELHKVVKRGFYLRPRYLLKRLLGMRTMHQLITSLSEFFFLVTKRS